MPNPDIGRPYPRHGASTSGHQERLALRFHHMSAILLRGSVSGRQENVEEKHGRRYMPFTD